MRPVARFAAVPVLVLLLGLHWALLQTVAWTGMLVDYSQGAPFREAVSKTFDGKHPCSLCIVIQQGRAEEKEQEQQQSKPGSKLDVGIVWHAAVFTFTSDAEEVRPAESRALSRSEEPPKPRPRSAPFGSLA